jgi:anaerobic ribonucleoside-triphosphate reductase activating protein
MMINEHEGITMKKLSALGSFDKGTTTKGINKLEKIGYVRLEIDPNDKRSKLIYTTEKAKDIISVMYIIRKDWWDHITKGLSIDEGDQFTKLLTDVVDNALSEVEDVENVHFYGIQKVTLLDYPSNIACTLFTGGCNFKCPYCHKSDLVFLPEHIVEIPIQDINKFLQKRTRVLEGVCISGGEPLLHTEIIDYLRKIKKLGYKIKIDTNGSFPDRLKAIVQEGLADYVAVDIKNSPESYAKTIGIENYDVGPIDETIGYLLDNNVDYEFRTTVVKEYHNDESMRKLGEWIKGAKKYYIQNYKDNEDVIVKGLHGFDEETLQKFKNIISPYVEVCEVRKS